MKKNILFIVILMGLLLSSCEPNRRDDVEMEARENIIRFSASVPNNSARVSLSENPNSLDLEVKFTPQDKFILFLVQNDDITSVETNPVNISANGKNCDFQIELPTSIDISKSLDIIGYTGFRTEKDANGEYKFIKIIDGEVYFCASPIRGQDLDTFSPPLSFSLKDVKVESQKISNLDVTFNHLGSYELIHVHNTSKMDRPANKLEVQLVDTDYTMAPTMSWAHSPYYVGTGTVFPYVSLSSGRIIEISKGTAYEKSNNPELKSGQTASFLTWYVPKKNAKYPRVSVYLKDIAAGYKRWSTDGYYSASEEPIKLGNVYHAYAKLADNGAFLTDSEGVEMVIEEPYISFTTNIPVGNDITLYTYFSASELNDAFIDLNDNGQKDKGEEIDSTVGYYKKKVQNERITIYGLCESLWIQGQQVTSTKISSTCLLTQLDLRKNNLSKESLDELYRQLPDIRKIEKSMVAQKTLKISSNPGSDDSDVSLAYRKGWEVDIPVIHSQSPYIHIWMNNSFIQNYGMVYINVDVENEADKADVWFDGNANGVKDKGEEITRFGMDASSMNSIPCTNENAILYGKISKLSMAESGVFAILDANHDHLKYLDLSYNGMVALALPTMTNLEYLDVSSNSFMTNVVPFDVSKYKKLKVLNLQDANISEIKDGLDNNKELTFLNISGNGWDSINLSNNTSLKVLVASHNSFRTLDIAALKSIVYIELIGNRLSTEELDALMKALPVNNSEDSNGLFIANNPGTSRANISIAKAKKWLVDVERLKGDSKINRPKFDGELW